ncbi:unnamed protein product [Parajaminaea phylloscopi]
MMAATPSPSAALGPSSAEQARHVSVLLRTMAPFPKSLCLRLPVVTSVEEILDGVANQLKLDASSASVLRLYTRSGRSLAPSTTLDKVLDDSGDSHGQPSHLDLDIRLCVLGGKGGFGSMLRAQGGKMSARKGEENTDACRDLNGRRLKTVKEAQSLAAYLAAAPEREAALSKAQSEKYAKLEKMLGRKPRTAGDFEEAAGRLDDAGGDLGGGGFDNNAAEDDVGAGPSRIVPVRGKEASASGIDGGAGSKRGVHSGSDARSDRRELFDDHKFLQESREAVGKAKDAVAMAMLKQKQKQKAKKAKATASEAVPAQSAAASG